MSSFIKEYSGVAGSVGRYWKHYGGFGALLFSPYFHFAIISALFLTPNWADREWFDVIIQTLPNIVGFSIGGYAVWLGFGDDKFRGLMTGANPGTETSPYLAANATFTHFIAVQVIALLAAIIAKALDFVPGNDSVLRSIYRLIHIAPEAAAAAMRLVGAFVSLTLFFYALALTLATGLALMRLATIFDRYRISVEDIKEPKQ